MPTQPRLKLELWWRGRLLHSEVVQGPVVKVPQALRATDGFDQLAVLAERIPQGFEIRVPNGWEAPRLLVEGQARVDPATSLRVERRGLTLVASVIQGQVLRPGSREVLQGIGWAALLSLPGVVLGASLAWPPDSVSHLLEPGWGPAGVHVVACTFGSGVRPPRPVPKLPPHRAPPRLTIGPGDEADDSLFAVVRQRELDFCAEVAHLAIPRVSQRTTLRWHLDERGRVSRARLQAGREALSPEFQSCVLSRLAGWRFPTGKDRDVSLPLTIWAQTPF